MRLSKSGVEIEEINTIAVLLVKTKVPNKYLLIDRETGQVYQGKNPGVGNKDHSWIHIGNITRKDMCKLENSTLYIDKKN